jgi:antitoxin component YwqK of YwqJK toxin-antitoxin module
MFCLKGFGQADSVKSENLELFVPGGNWDKSFLHEAGKTEPFTGVMIDYFPNSSKVEQSVEYVNGKLKVGGYSRRYNLNDRLLEETQNGKNGDPDGSYLAWYEDGQIEMSGSYRRGNYNGIWTAYYPSGKMKYINRYNEGKKQGTCKTWSESGELISEEVYRNDTVVKKIK